MAQLYTDFTPGPDKSTLPQAFQNCLVPNPAAGCDDVVGGTQVASGFCADPAYADTRYCACVNNKLACPFVTSPACQNSGDAYRPSWQREGGNAYEVCMKRPLCINEINTSGSRNSMWDIIQSCGGTGAGVMEMIRAHPFIAVVLMMAVLSVVLFLVPEGPSPPRGAAGGAASTAAPPQ